MPARHLVFIGLDGWGGAYVSGANMPTVKRMMSGGASSLDFRCIMPSNSRPNWKALFSGTAPEDHNMDSFPTIFSLIKDSKQNEESILFYEWNELLALYRDDTADIIKIFSDSESTGLIADYIKERKPLFTAIVYNEPDHIGHDKRWGSAAYYAKLKELDGYIAVIEQAVKDAGIYNETVFVLSSDHGGTMWGHGLSSRRQRRIPLVIYGSMIKKGFVIPAGGSICDIAPTMAAILGLKVPDEWTGQFIRGIFR